MVRLTAVRALGCAVLGVALPVSLGVLLVDPSGDTPPAEPTVVGLLDRPEVEAVQILREWDLRRAAAWADGDQRALADLYLPGSAAGRADRRMLASWLARGLRVRDLRTQILTVRVAEAEADRMVIDVTDRLAAGTAFRGAAQTALPAGGVSRRRVELRRVHGRWRVEATTSLDRWLDRQRARSGARR